MSSREALQLDVVTPTRKIVDAVTVSSVTLPGSRGELEVLPGHAELLTELRPGRLQFVHDGQTRTFAVSYGFAEVRRDRVILLAETCEESAEIDRERAAAAAKRASEKLTATLSQEEFRKHQAKLQRALIRQQLAQH